jgi:UDP-GlcNAc:undecaprenyl-phosphate GlcNAc-1-phosphate transferase
MIWTQKSSTLLSMLVPLLALSIPLLDVSLSVLRRFLRNQPIFSADRGHIHHRLLDRGFSAKQAVWVLYLFAALAAALALLSSSSLGGKYQGVVMVFFALAVWIGIRQLRYSEFDIAGRFLFGGGFQRTLDSRIKLERLSTALSAAKDEDGWWEKLVEGAQSLGLAEVRWQGPGGVRVKLFTPQAMPSWSFRVWATESDVIEISGAFSGDSAASIDLMRFAETVKRTFCASSALQPAGTTAAATS